MSSIEILPQCCHSININSSKLNSIIIWKLIFQPMIGTYYAGKRNKGENHMNTLNYLQRTSNLYTQSTNQVSSTKVEAKTHHHKKQAQDSVDISQQSLQTLSSTSQSTNTNPFTSTLDSLVSSGAISQDQETAIQSAFEASRNSARTSGTYTPKTTNPIDSLVSSGTITKDQATSIKDALKTSMSKNKPQDPPKDPGSEVLDNLVSTGTITQDQENTIQNALKSAFSNFSNNGAENYLDNSTTDSVTSA